METQQTILIYGNSLVLSGIQLSLKACPSFEVITLDLTASQAKLLASSPDAVIFDLGAVQPDFPLAMLQHPDLLLIGIDPKTHQALVWSGRQFSALSMQELFALIQKGGQEERRRT